MLRLHNTLTRKIETLEPLKRSEVSVYTCGPTVYDYPHIGNWFTFVRYDLLIRLLKHMNLKPVWVLNITDVGHLVSDADEGDDKLQVGAKREGKTAWEIAKYYSQYFLDGLDRLNISKPTYTPKATDHIGEQIDLIQRLESADYTYIIDDGVYYDTSKFSKYADFANLDVDEQQAGVRVEFNPQKKNSTDFALWKFSKASEKRDMEWESPWGRGFPGWHIECSAMLLKYLGKTIDIHCGGIEHIPVHHTNEIAQAEALTGKPLAKIWMHTNHISIDGQKISKSLGNTILLEDVEKRGFSIMALRMLVLESHYRTQSKFTWENVKAAETRLRSLYNLAELRWQTVSDNDSGPINYEEYIHLDITKPLLDDLNTPKVLANISQHESLISENLVTHKSKPSFLKYLSAIDDCLGLDLMKQHDISLEQKDLIIKRNAARVDNKWAASDRLRDQLKEEGVGLRDTNYGSIWYRY
ncbi:MAG TPA: cysteine--tRNA ligase [Candidatus Saccharimonadales bacterium]|nr:cysteine--tRNA ligase [Candidatus Saccharimonadales bacterium]